MRVLGATLQRVGLLIVGGTLLGGFVVAAYAIGDGLHRLAAGELVGEREVFEHLILYPVGAAMAGGLAAIVGLVLIYLGDGAPRAAR